MAELQNSLQRVTDGPQRREKIANNSEVAGQSHSQVARSVISRSCIVTLAQLRQHGEALECDDILRGLLARGNIAQQMPADFGIDASVRSFLEERRIPDAAAAPPTN